MPCPNVILSYPKSSRNWTTYLVNRLAPQHTFGGYHGNIVSFWRDFEQKCENLICVIRNYKECITIYSIKDNDLDITDKEIVWQSFMSELKGQNAMERGFDSTDYISNIKLYDQTNKNKYLIYYEDLIANPEIELLKIADFLKTCQQDDAEIKAKKILENYNYHKQICLNEYKNRLYTNGDPNKLLFHSAKLNKEIKIKLDNYIAINWPKLWDKYLKRYKDEEI